MPCDATDTAPAAWAVDFTVGPAITLPSGESLDRDAFFGWLWEQGAAHGLQGICEGTVAADEAAALGLAESSRVIDAAAAPPDRDWVGSLAEPLVTCWFGDEPAARAVAAQLAEVQGCCLQGIRREPWPDQETDWRRSFQPIDVPGFGVIRPAWEEGVAEATPRGASVFIEPGAGFGTGLHETTQLCLGALADWTREGGAIARVLDFGSGSGILGIAAAVHGARVVDAVEIDPLVHDAIRANAHRNGVGDRVRVWREMPLAEARDDLVLANIVASVLLNHVDRLCSRLRPVDGGPPAGCLVLSGLLADDLSAVSERYALALGTAPLHTSMGEWNCLRFVMPDARTVGRKGEPA